ASTAPSSSSSPSVAAASVSASSGSSSSTISSCGLPGETAAGALGDFSACSSARTAAARGSRFCVQSRSSVLSAATASSVFPIVRRELQRLLPDPACFVPPSGIEMDPAELLQDRHRLGDLPQVLERARQHLQGPELTRVRLEADLQLGQRPLRIAAAEILLGQLLRQRHVVLVEVADALRDPQVVVLPAVAL